MTKEQLLCSTCVDKMWVITSLTTSAVSFFTGSLSRKELSCPRRDPPLGVPHPPTDGGKVIKALPLQPTTRQLWDHTCSARPDVVGWGHQAYTAAWFLVPIPLQQGNLVNHLYAKGISETSPGEPDHLPGAASLEGRGHFMENAEPLWSLDRQFALEMKSATCAWILPEVKYFKSPVKRNAEFLQTLLRPSDTTNNSSGSIEAVKRKSSGSWIFYFYIFFYWFYHLLFDLEKFI